MSQERAGKAADLYLDLLSGALLDEHYVENELRIEHILDAVKTGRAIDLEKLADPVRYMAKALQERRRERRAGELPTGPSDQGGTGFAYAGLGRVRLDHLRTCLETIRAQDVPGDLVESGTGRGGAGIFMRGFLEVREMPGRRVLIADRFDSSSSLLVGGIPGFASDLSTVRDAFARFHLLDERVVFLQGSPTLTLREAAIDEVALLRIKSDDAAEVHSILELLYDRLSPGGCVIVDGFGAEGCRESVEAFRSTHRVEAPLERVDWSAAFWRKEAATGSIVAANRRRRTTPTKDLGVVVVVHNMRREAHRTLHSLSRSYQQGVDDLDYEVLVVENGSAPGQSLDEDFVRGFGPEFRYLDLGEDSEPSPAKAINHGINLTDATTLGLMIDGAHVLTPGVLYNAMLGSSTYEPAVVAAKQWYVGPGQQPITVSSGYGQELEDRLFAEISWPTDGYRLFEISHFIGNRDWFDGDWESNCLFVPRALIDQAGGMDEAFSAPGGGFVNLDFFDRVVTAPGVTLVTMLGEGSFHQVHGGTTTNASRPDEVVGSYRAQYEELRGRRFYVPRQQAHFVGSLPPVARRIRPRPTTDFQRFTDAYMKGQEKQPAGPAPIPQDLRSSFIDAFWRSGEWHDTLWLGRPTHRAPADLITYQELIFRLRPDWIVETRTGAGGRAWFLASICDLVDHGKVLSIDSYPLAGRPKHDRITYLAADPAGQSAMAQTRDMVGDPARCLLIIGGASNSQVVAAYRNLENLVPVGGYLVVEDTILEANPVWPDFGSGPADAAKEIVASGNFVPDPWYERFAATFNVGGFLKRVR